MRLKSAAFLSRWPQIEQMSSAFPGKTERGQQTGSKSEEAAFLSQANFTLPSRTGSLLPVLFPSLGPWLIQAWPGLSLLGTFSMQTVLGVWVRGSA